MRNSWPFTWNRKEKWIKQKFQWQSSKNVSLMKVGIKGTFKKKFYSKFSWKNIKVINNYHEKRHALFKYLCNGLRKNVLLNVTTNFCENLKITLNLSFIPRCRGCNFCEQADGIIARQAPRLTINFWLTGLVWVWNESAIKTNLNQNYLLCENAEFNWFLIKRKCQI